MTKKAITWDYIVKKVDKLSKSRDEDEKDIFEYMGEALDLSTEMSGTWHGREADNKKFSLAKMEKAGRRDGEERPPKPDSKLDKPWGTIESEVIKAYESWCSEVHNVFQKFSQLMEAKLNKIKVTIEHMDAAQNKNSPEPIGNFYSTQMNELVPEGVVIGDMQTALKNCKDAFNEELERFRIFRAEHGLQRSPKYEASVLAFVFVAIICIVLETAVNGFMYGQASDLGLIGGWGVAAGLSIIIFSSSFLAGWVLTYKNGLVEVKDSASKDPIGWKRSLWLQLTGWSGWVTLTAVILILIAFVCVYRDEAVTLDPGSGNHPMSEAINRVVTFDLLPQADIEGLFLIFVNLAIMLIGMYKGYTHFDKVPNYKNRATALAGVRKEYRSVIEEAKHNLGISDKVVSGSHISYKKRSFQDGLSIYDNLYVDKLVDTYCSGVKALESLRRSCEGRITSAEEECNSCLTSYRRANENARFPDRNPSPEYFKKPWESSFELTLEYDGSKEIGKFRDLNTDVIANALQKHRSEALEMLAKKAEKRYAEMISEHESESNKHRDEVNQNEL